MMAGRLSDVSWRELHRTGDAREAMTVLTSIAAMEFEARCPGASLRESNADNEGWDLGNPPYIIEVREQNWADLQGVLAMLLEEQAEFDRACEARQERRRRADRWMVLVVAVGALLAMLLATLGCSSDDRQARLHAPRLSPA